MKILIAGNLVNNGYYLAKLLRKVKFDADLLLQKYPKESDDPKTFDRNLREYPEWIKFWDNSKGNWKFEIIKTMKRYDLIQASTELPIFAMFSFKPFISFTTGSDAIELAHTKSLKGFLLRQAYKKSKVVIFPGLYMYPSIIELRIKNYIFLPLLWDYEKFQTKEEIPSNDRLIIFHPTRHDWKFKGNDKLMRAYVRLAKERNDVHLILINNGSDFQKSLEILRKGSIEGKYTVIPHRLTQNELQDYYTKVDVIADYFNLGSMGLIGQEAMACRKPLINYVDERLFQEFYHEIPPIVNAQTEDEIFKALIMLSDDRKKCKKIGEASREWLLRHHNPEKIIKKYIFIYESIHNKIKYESLRDGLNQI